jgi:hypothetical protein
MNTRIGSQSIKFQRACWNAGQELPRSAISQIPKTVMLKNSEPDRDPHKKQNLRNRSDTTYNPTLERKI